jgi:hypothetical protein
MLSSGRMSPEVPFFTRFHACRLQHFSAEKLATKARFRGEGEVFHYYFF